MGRIRTPLSRSPAAALRESAPEATVPAAPGWAGVRETATREGARASAEGPGPEGLERRGSERVTHGRPRGKRGPQQSRSEQVAIVSSKNQGGRVKTQKQSTKTCGRSGRSVPAPARIVQKIHTVDLETHFLQDQGGVPRPPASIQDEAFIRRSSKDSWRAALLSATLRRFPKTKRKPCWNFF